MRATKRPRARIRFSCFSPANRRRGSYLIQNRPEGRKSNMPSRTQRLRKRFLVTSIGQRRPPWPTRTPRSNMPPAEWDGWGAPDPKNHDKCPGQKPRSRRPATLPKESSASSMVLSRPFRLTAAIPAQKPFPILFPTPRRCQIGAGERRVARLTSVDAARRTCAETSKRGRLLTSRTQSAHGAALVRFGRWRRGRRARIQRMMRARPDRWKHSLRTPCPRPAARD